MSLNAERSKRQRIRDDWWYFDRLSPKVRSLLADCAFNYDSKWLYDNLKKGVPFSIIEAAAKGADLDRCLKDNVTALPPIYTRRGY